MTVPYPSNPDWPAHYMASTLTGKFIGADGSSLAGERLTIAMPIYVNVPIDDTIVVPASITVTLDQDGFFRVAVPATDDPDIQPVYWTYTVTELWPNGRTYSVDAPAGQTIDLSTVIPAQASLGSVNYVGPTGPDGPVGPQGVHNQGIWSSVAAYHVNDIVTFQPSGQGTSSYVALAANTASRPDITPSMWQVFAAGGVDGLPGTANLGPVVVSGAPTAGQALIATDATHATWGALALPPGLVLAWPGTLASVPGGWYPCDGSTKSRTADAGLFAAIGTVWGAGNGTTTFNLPNFASRFLNGSGAGLLGGAATHDHTLTAAEVASHIHPLSSNGATVGHTHTTPSQVAPDHTHHLDDLGQAAITLASVAAPNVFARRVACELGWTATLQQGFGGGATPNAGVNATGIGLTGITNTVADWANPIEPMVTTSAAPALTGTTDAASPGLTGTTDNASSLPPYAGVLWIIKN